MASPILVQPDVAQRQPHLELLPAEVFEMVAEVADEKDLLALRLTSRQCASKILKTYTKVHFTEILFRPRDLASLMKCFRISGHPVFRHVVRTITISIDRCDRKEDNVCQVMHDSDFERKGLGLLFECLARYTKTTALRIVAREHPVATSDPRDSGDVHPYYPDWNLNMTCKRVFVDIMQILQSTPLNITSLDIATGTNWGLPMLELNDAEMDCLISLLAPLERLSLTVWRSICLIGQDCEPVNKLLKVLGNSKSLKDLSIHVQSMRRSILSS